MAGRKQTQRSAQRRVRVEAPFRSYAPERHGAPRFSIRIVERTQRLYPAHKHDYFQVLYFMSAAPTLRIGLASHRPKAGSIYFVAPMVSHQIRFDQGTRCIVLYFDLDFLHPGLSRSYPISELVRLLPELTPFAWQNYVDFNARRKQADRIESLITSMNRENDKGGLFAQEMMRAELSLLLATVCRDHEAEFARLSTRLPAVGRDSGHMRRISAFIEDNYLRGPGLEEAAKAVGLSRSRFCALIRQYTGSTFNLLIRDMRMEDACERLVLTGDSIGQIAYRVGYNDEKYFLRAFKNAVGMTPSAYRLKQAKAKGAFTEDQAS
ncbi:AraC family transcriptional regulator [Methylocella sp. CPCC 101449]|uniref:helix-turn-helix transcriptional regulator n=1 Tax=Methylocella sp. CPCC 101449 TaxID=2987531 RepID=UPI00288EA0CF|nr:AraC family transcriptional regulator [Methylocella sp. CPCC 101449]MDT2023878.1 AraC family transcriptional regulator [Methylocella sp. CPCC 101449]